MKEELLFSDFRLKRYAFKNRMGVAPMTRMSSQHDSIPRQDVLDFLVRRAKNEAAIVYTEAIVTDYESAQGVSRAGEDADTAADRCLETGCPRHSKGGGRGDYANVSLRTRQLAGD